jgi:hypothetical protein
VRAAVRGVRLAGRAAAALQPADDVRGGRERQAEHRRELGQCERPERADGAEHGVAVGRDAVSGELSLDELAHALVCGEQLEQE